MLNFQMHIPNNQFNFLFLVMKLVLYITALPILNIEKDNNSTGIIKQHWKDLN